MNGTGSRRAPRAAESLRTVIAGVGATGLGVLPIWLLSGLAVQIGADLGVGESDLGVAVALYFTVSALASVPGGRLVERIGWVRGVVSTTALGATAMVGVALVGRSWTAVVAVLLVGALGNALSQPAANLAVAQVVRSGRQGLAFGVKQAAMPITTLLVGLAVPLLGATLGWRWAFAVAAVLATAIVLLPPPAARARARGSWRARTRSTVPLRSGDATLGVLVPLAIGAGLGTAATNSIGGFLVAYGATRGLGPGAAGSLLVLGSAVGVLVRVAAGFLADRATGGHLLACAAMMAGGAAGLLVLAGAGTSAVALFLGTALAFGLGWSWNGLFAFAVVRTNPNAPAAATGIVQTTKYACGTVGPLLFGFAAERISYAVAWTGAAAALALGALSLVLGHTLVRRPSGAPQPSSSELDG